MRARLIPLLILTTAPVALAQFSSTYRQAAQAYNNAAAQCQSPAGASCLRQNASYYSCLSNQMQGGGSCGTAPSCSTACTSSGSGSSAGSLAAGANLSQKQQLALTGLSLALSWLSNRHHSDSTPNPAQDESIDAAQASANEAAAEAAIAEANKESSDLAKLRAAITAGADPSTLGTAAADPSVALRNQLTAGAEAATAGPEQPSDPSDAIAAQRAQMTAQANAEEVNDTSTSSAPLVDGIVPASGPTVAVAPSPQPEAAAPTPQATESTSEMVVAPSPSDYSDILTVKPGSDQNVPQFRAALPTDQPANGSDATPLTPDQQAEQLLVVPQMDSYKPFIDAAKVMTLGPEEFLWDAVPDKAEDKILDVIKESASENSCSNPQNAAYCSSARPAPTPNQAPK